MPGSSSGTVRRFPRGTGLKVPHMGWNQLRFRFAHPVFEGIPDNSSFYFVHSYYPCPAVPELSAAETDYGVTFAAAVARDNLIAFQFHSRNPARWG